jgi:hypothetical protein
MYIIRYIIIIMYIIRYTNRRRRQNLVDGHQHGECDVYCDVLQAGGVAQGVYADVEEEA